MMSTSRLKPALQKRHIHIFAAFFLLAIGTYQHQMGPLFPEGYRIMDSLMMFGFLFSIPYVIWYGLRVAPWNELKSIIALGHRTRVSISFFAAMIASYLGMAGDAEAFYMSIPAGVQILSLLVGITAIATLLTISLIPRFLLRKVTDSGGLGGNNRLTTEEKVTL